MLVTTKSVRDKIVVDTLSQKNGVFTARVEFFYRHGQTSEDLANHIKRAIPNATIIDSGEVWKAFRGGATTANSSHWWVKFIVNPEA